MVLCRAQEAGNVGSACRAMKTMGITRLVLADCPDYDEDRVATMAVHAFDVYRGARRFATLEEALSGFSVSAGLTRRRGERRKAHSLSVRDFAAGLCASGGGAALPAGSAALVFGNEKDGLSDRELSACSRAVHIPSSDAFPSLNLAQAVQVACYELFMAALDGRDGSADAADRTVTEASARRIADALAGLGFFRKADDLYCRTFLRDLAERASLSIGELDYLTRLFLKTAAIAGGRGAPRRHAAGPGGSASGGSAPAGSGGAPSNRDAAPSNQDGAPSNQDGAPSNRDTETPAGSE